MEQLIQFRLHASHLQVDESTLLIQNIIQSFGNDKIISFIFNHFLYKYTHSENNEINDLQNIINMTTDIIEARKKKKKKVKNEQNDIVIDSNHNDNRSTKIDTLPPEMIRECASFLPAENYCNFAVSNRIIYIACNSPCSLVNLKIYNKRSFMRYQQSLTLTSLPLLKSLEVNPFIFNQHIDPRRLTANSFQNVTSLTLNHIYDGDHSKVETFVNSIYINLENIEILCCYNLGKKFHLYEFDGFCSLLARCVNVTLLSVGHVHLTDMTADTVIKSLPHLQMISEYGNNSNTNNLRDILINNYQNQLTALNYDGRVDMIKYNELNDIKFPQLYELLVHVSVSHSDSAVNIMKIKPNNLKRFWLDMLCVNGVITDGIKKLMQWLFTECLKIEFIAFQITYDQFVLVTQLIETIMLNRDKKKYDTLRLFIHVEHKHIVNDADMNAILLYALRIVNAINTEVVSDFIIDFRFICNVVTDAKKKKRLINKFKTNYGVFANGNGTYQRVVIYNKHCKLNGFIHKLNTIYYS
eukprot:530534_1